MALPSKCGQNVSAVSGNLQSDLPVIRCHSRCIHRCPQPASQRPAPVEHSNQCTSARSLSAASQSTPPKDCSSCQIHIEFKRENSPYANRLQPSQLAGCPIPCCVRCVGSLKDTDFSPYIDSSVRTARLAPEGMSFQTDHQVSAERRCSYNRGVEVNFP